MWLGLLKASSLNMMVHLPAMKQAKQQLQDGSWLKLAASTEGVQLYFALDGCKGGKQHHRYCTPHALRGPHSLWCQWCSYDPISWTAAGMKLIPETEIKLMRMLAALHMDVKCCAQVCVRWWPAPVDFMFVQDNVILQVDGSGHFTQFYGKNAGQALDTDMRFCLAAWQQNVSVVRVHDSDLSKKFGCAFFAAAMQHASSKQCIVLSPSYSTVKIYHQGGLHAYLELLSAVLGGAVLSVDKHDNVVMRRN